MEPIKYGWHLDTEFSWKTWIFGFGFTRLKDETTYIEAYVGLGPFQVSVWHDEPAVVDE